MKRIYFKDNGQDFLWWEINPNGLVTDCGPFQASVWVGTKVLYPYNLTTGGEVDFISKQGGVFTLKHRIEKIETIETI